MSAGCHGLTQIPLLSALKVPSLSPLTILTTQRHNATVNWLVDISTVIFSDYLINHLRSLYIQSVKCRSKDLYGQIDLFSENYLELNLIAPFPLGAG